MEAEERKRKEIEHSDFRRSIVRGHEYRTDASVGETRSDLVAREEEYDRHFSNMKFYAITRSSNQYRDGRLLADIRGRTVLDYCCGNGEVAIQMARAGALKVYGIDISSVAIENAKQLAAAEGVAGQCSFEVRDAESTGFPDAHFDIIHEYGALHHLELMSALRELARVLKPGGRVVCTEALRHNPLIHWYRCRTPHLRTQWETDHILGVPELCRAREFFVDVEVRFFHLAALMAVPFRRQPFFRPLLTCLEVVDGVLLRVPYVQRWAWIAVAILGDPRR